MTLSAADKRGKLAKPGGQVLAALATLLALPAGVTGEATMARPESFRVSTMQRQLFLDEYGIAGMENLQRVLHQPLKKGAVIRPTPPAEESRWQIRMAPCWDVHRQVFRLLEFEEQQIWESGDGLHWQKVARNVGQKVMAVVYDAADADQPYKAFMPSLVPSGPAGMGVSADMVTWKTTALDPVPGGDEWNLSLAEPGHLFLATVKRGGTYGRSVALATSTNCLTWRDHGLIFQADDEDQRLGRERIKAHLANPRLQQPFWNNPTCYNVDVYNMGLFVYEGIYIGLPAMFHSVGYLPSMANTVGFHLVEVICSRDLATWTRVGNRQPFIGPSPVAPGVYDLSQVLPPSAPIVRGDELWFYYSGIKYRGEPEYRGPAKLDPDTGAICLAVLRRDGFVSLDAGETAGVVRTQPFALSGTKVFVNVDAPNGELRVELLDQAGLTLAVSHALTGNLPRAEVVWNRGKLADLKGKTVSLRFALRTGQLYSYWIAD